MAEALDFSQTQRIVFLVDLHPLLHLQNPSAFITSILASARTLLTFPSLFSSLFAFKFFFSSLSPLLSTSKLHGFLGKSAASFSFGHPSEILISLSETLDSLSTISGDVTSPSRASQTASSLYQLIHDYAWEPEIKDLTGMPKNLPVVRSNLILLFSPIPRSMKCLAEFMDVEMDDESLLTLDAFCMKFLRTFGNLNKVFCNRDIHLSWIDVSGELECNGKWSENNRSALGIRYLERGIKNLCWGLCSTDAIILGSALAPFGLIYPKICFPSSGFYSYDCCKRVQAELSLEILDVTGRPLECKCCNITLLNLDMLPRQIVEGISQTLWECTGDGALKIQIKAVQGNDETVKIEDHASSSILVFGFGGQCVKDQEENSDGFFENWVLKILRMGMNEFMPGKSMPIWQLILCFLYREGYHALVSISNGNGASFMGILKPFTVHLALLSIIGSGSFPQNIPHASGASSSLSKFVTKTGSEICKAQMDINQSNPSILSQSQDFSCESGVALENGKGRKNKKNSNLCRELTWGSFYAEAHRNCEMSLEEVCFARGCNNSKKGRFLKCWMRQVKRSSSCFLTKINEMKSHQDTGKAMEENLIWSQDSQQESEQPDSLPTPAGDDFLNGASDIKEQDVCVSGVESFEAFFGSISQKIQHGLESAELDLGALAERLVNLSIHWLYWKYEMENATEVQLDDTCGMVVAELVKLLLKEPKDLAVKYKGYNPISDTSDPSSTVYTSEAIVREYELQILFRMEILQSKVRMSIDESARQKIIRQTCSLLEIIQYHLAGGFFGGVNLDTYVARTIKRRYSHSLGDVVSRIYTRMDLMPFDYENEEASGSLNNSEDSDQSWREKPNRYEVGENFVGKESTFMEAEASQRSEKNDSLQEVWSDEHLHRLVEAKQGRERARRFASFTSWVPDLRRVWAPKQLKGARAKAENVKNLSNRKERRRAGCDVVCETPMTGNKRSCTRESIVEHEDTDCGTSGGSVSKALFQDNGDHKDT